MHALLLGAGRKKKTKRRRVDAAPAQKKLKVETDGVYEAILKEVKHLRARNAELERALQTSKV